MSAPGRTGRGSYAREGFFPVDREPLAEHERPPSSRPTPLVPLPVMRAVAAREQADAVAREAYRDGVPAAPEIARTRRGIGFPVAPAPSAASEPNPLPPADPYSQTEPAEAFALRRPISAPPSPLPEQPFWDPRPSLRPSSVPSVRTSQLPLPPPSFARRLLTRLVFFTIFSAVLLLLATEISIRFQLPWLDPRPGLLKLGAATTRLWHRLH